MNNLQIERLDPETGHVETITGAAAAVAVMHDANLVLAELARKLGLRLIAVSAGQDPDHGRVTIGATLDVVQEPEDLAPSLFGRIFQLGDATYEVTGATYRFPGDPYGSPAAVKCRSVPDDGTSYTFPISIVEGLLAKAAGR